MTPEHLLQSIRKGEAAPAYLFSGPETMLKQQAIEALVATVPESLRSFNVQVFHAFEDEVADALTAARTLPFMAPRRIVILRDIEKTRLDQGRRGELLSEYLDNPSPETVFVVTTEDDAKAKALAKAYGERWVPVEFRALQGPALAAALRAEAGRLGCSIEGEAVAALLEATGADLGRAKNELAKLRAAVGAGGAVDTAVVARYAAGYEHHGNSDIIKAITSRDLAGTLRLLQEITIKDGEFLLVLGMLGKQLRVLWYLSGGAPPPREFWMKPEDMAHARAHARRFTRAEIEQGLEGLRRLDDRVKSTEVPPRLLLEHFLLEFLPERR